MEKRLHTYEGDEITITYDSKRCIHAAECVKGLRDVFNPDQKPWIQPQKGDADAVAEVVSHCPTGALHYESSSRTISNEETPRQNTISVSADGPIYFRGDIEVRDHDDNLILKDSRFALCRCGKSANKPACDNSHAANKFEAHTHIPRKNLKETESSNKSGVLAVRAMKDGPVLIEGAYTIYSNTSQPISSDDTIALCRCGGSSNKPFCDGTHKKINFTS